MKHVYIIIEKSINAADKILCVAYAESEAYYLCSLDIKRYYVMAPFFQGTNIITVTSTEKIF